MHNMHLNSFTKKKIDTTNYSYFNICLSRINSSWCCVKLLLEISDLDFEQRNTQCLLWPPGCIFTVNSCPSPAGVNIPHSRHYVLTSSSFIIRGRSCVLLAISSKLSKCPPKFLIGTKSGPLRGLSVPVLSPPGCRENPSTPRQLLSAEAGRGAKSELKESDGDPTTETCRREPASSGVGLRITPALLLLGIHRARKSAWEYWGPAGDDMLTALSQTQLSNPGFEQQITVTG